jgi:hypothetical protein
MKITFDKIASAPYHAMSLQDAKRLFSLLPAKWVSEVTSVRFSNQDFKTKSLYERPAHFDYQVTRRLTVLSRGLSKCEAAEHIMIELCQCVWPGTSLFTSSTKAATGSDLGPTQLKELKKKIAPYLKQFTEGHNKALDDTT